MRPIKFRGKRQDNGEWAYGSLVIDGAYYIVDGVAQREVFPETVGQYTGLLNKSGQEVWEGDIVEFNWVGNICRDEVIFSEGAFRAPLLQYAFNRNVFRVVGNIHDNPELLKNPKKV